MARYTPRSYLGPNLSVSSSEEFQSIVRHSQAEDTGKHIGALETALRDKFQELESANHEMKVLNKEMSDREKGLALLQASLERQQNYTNKAKEERDAARLAMNIAEKGKKQALEELRQKSIQVSLADRSQVALQEKHQNVRDLTSYQDQIFKSDQEVKRLNSVLVAKEGELRSAQNSVKKLEIDIHTCQEKAEDNLRKETSNQFAQLNRQIAELAEENKVLKRQVQKFDIGNTEAAFTRSEEVEAGHHDMLVLQAELKRVKQKLDASEAEVRSERGALQVATQRLQMMHEVLRTGSSHRSSRGASLKLAGEPVSPGYTPMSPASLTLNNPSLHPSPEVHTVEAGKEGEQAGDDFAPSAPAPASSFVDVVPAGLFELLQKEVTALRQDIKERDQHLLDKDVSVEAALRKADNFSKMRELDLKKYQRETTEMKRELKHLKSEAKRGVSNNSGKWAM
eukprot:CAMPEP_0196575110 /NCGR_PEP_ID=MMETSP1081-20130531/4665_1 /TAXON_ID=36882 /ORGANISM="Pyramimonas amylifera, Strain CCMP720" /LENGTH=453 /DNA_ID=CAMNT_0041893311 /DNA_START=220 /DNA_END=1581 /DNA_ORIENTATION=+